MSFFCCRLEYCSLLLFRFSIWCREVLIWTFALAWCAFPRSRRHRKHRSSCFSWVAAAHSLFPNRLFGNIGFLLLHAWSMPFVARYHSLLNAPISVKEIFNQVHWRRMHLATRNLLDWLLNAGFEFYYWWSWLLAVLWPRYDTLIQLLDCWQNLCLGFIRFNCRNYISKFVAFFQAECREHALKGGLVGQFLDCGKTILLVLLDQRQLDCQLGITVPNILLAQKCECFRIVGHLPK